LALSPASLSGALPAILAFPFAQIGRGLRALSLPSSPGGAGNITAIVLYAAFCLLPVFALVFIRKKRPEDALLLVISVMMFFVIYYIINMRNPGAARIPTLTIPLMQALMGGAIHSLLIAYGVIRVLRHFSAASEHELGRYISVALHLLNIVFVFIAFGFNFAQMLDALRALGVANTMPGQQLGLTRVFLVLRYIVNALPYVLSVWVVFAVQRLAAALKADSYSQEALTAARAVSRVCAVVLTASVLAIAGFNLLQLMFISGLYVININVNFPAISILFVLGALLLSRHIAESKRLKDENDQFV